jgi:hypothetical protein
MGTILHLKLRVPKSIGACLNWQRKHGIVIGKGNKIVTDLQLLKREIIFLDGILIYN